MKKFDFRFFVGLVFSFILILCFNVEDIYASKVNVGSVSAASSFSDYSDIDVSGYIPQITSGLSETNINSLNSRIMSQCKQKVENLQSAKNNKKINFSSEDKSLTHNGKNFLSIIIYVNVPSNNVNKVTTLSFNIDTGTGITAYLEDFIGPNYQSIVTNEIKGQIDSKPDKYSDIYKALENSPTGVFPQVTKTQGFYIKNSSTKVLTVFYYDREFDIYLGNIINKEYTYQKPKETFDLKTVPLRDVCQDFGYTIEWNGLKRSIDVKKGKFVVTVTVNKNSYVVNNEGARALDYAPILLDNKTHVPISFFEQILGINYSISGNKVTFSYYKH